jgi:hypothetical protein
MNAPHPNIMNRLHDAAELLPAQQRPAFMRAVVNRVSDSRPVEPRELDRAIQFALSRYGVAIGRNFFK